MNKARLLMQGFTQLRCQLKITIFLVIMRIDFKNDQIHVKTQLSASETKKTSPQTGRGLSVFYLHFLLVGGEGLEPPTYSV